MAYPVREENLDDINKCNVYKLLLVNYRFLVTESCCTTTCLVFQNCTYSHFKYTDYF